MEDIYTQYELNALCEENKGIELKNLLEIEKIRNSKTIKEERKEAMVDMLIHYQSEKIAKTLNGKHNEQCRIITTTS